MGFRGAAQGFRGAAPWGFEGRRHGVSRGGATDKRLQYYKVLQSITEYYRSLQSITEYYRVLQSFTECYRVSQSVTECYRVLQSVTECSITETNLAHLLGLILGLVYQHF